MTGYWVGSFGDQMLEENWMVPAGGNITAQVRMSAGAATAMLEFILIEQVETTLRFRVRQWLSGFVPRQPEPWAMELASLEDRRIAFVGVGDAHFKTLVYSRPEDDRFRIEVDQVEGGPFAIDLRPR